MTHDSYVRFFKKNGPTPASFSFIFVLSNKHYKFYNKHVCEKCPSSIQCQDSNSQPLEHEPPPITTRPGLPAQNVFIYKDYRGNGPEHFSLIWNILKNEPFPASFSFIFFFSWIKFRRWLYLNRGPLVSEATTLPTEPQPLPQVGGCYPEMQIQSKDNFYSNFVIIFRTIFD